MEWNIFDKFIAFLRYQRILKHIKEDDIVCDIGCGREATFLRHISSKIKKGYGFDFRIQNAVYDNIKVKNNKDFDGLPLPDESCSKVLLVAVLEHLNDPARIFSESQRILIPNGEIILTTPTRIARPILEFMAFKLHIINKDEILEHKHYYTKAEIFKLFKMSGYNDATYSYHRFEFGVNSIATAKK